MWKMLFDIYDYNWDQPFEQSDPRFNGGRKKIHKYELIFDLLRSLLTWLIKILIKGMSLQK